MTIKDLSAKLERLTRLANREQGAQGPIITCHWEDEHIEPESGVEIIKTVWGRGTAPRRHEEEDSITRE